MHHMKYGKCITKWDSVVVSHLYYFITLLHSPYKMWITIKNTLGIIIGSETIISTIYENQYPTITNEI